MGEESDGVMDKVLRRYYQQKQKHKEIEQELARLRDEIIGYCSDQGTSEVELAGHKARIVTQERKEYDDAKLYEALPEPLLWRMVSRADASKVASLVKLNVLTEEGLKDTYAVKTVKLLQVEKK
ncbi:hypothetical protein D3C78_896760 [compost metagenome]